MQQVPSLRGIRVLVVDNDRAIREAVGLILQEQGADVFAAATVPEALAIFDRCRPDVLITDINMPGEDGYALLRQLQALEARTVQASPTFAIAMTASSRADDRQHLQAAGFQRVLLKPFGQAELVDAIASLRNLE